MTTPIPCRQCGGPKPLGSRYVARVYCSPECRDKAKNARRHAHEAAGMVGRNQWSERQHACPKCSHVGMLVRVIRSGRNRWLCQPCADAPRAAQCSTCEGMSWRREMRCRGCGEPYAPEPVEPVEAHIHTVGNLARWT